MDVQKDWRAGRLIHMEHFSELIEQAHAGDKKARDTLVANNLGLVHAVARRFVNRGHDREEIFQIGCIGLMKAIDKFDVTLQTCVFHLCGSDDRRRNSPFFAG